MTSLSTDFTPSVFTNYGMPADIAAPGGDLYYHKNHSDAGQVLSTVLKLDGMYAYMSGTSMSCPHVSGVAALGLSYAKQLGKTFEPDEFRDMVLASVNDLDPYLTGVKKHNNGTMNLVEYKGKMGSHDRRLQDADGCTGYSGDHGRAGQADDDFAVEILRGCYCTFLYAGGERCGER